ncbi:cation:proton antiporter [Zavarzinella formosa]|uniref:cation:proton antiporter n=1 Tax=Zavarzinella formosa TaxID=360055 RepID=UPI0002E50A1D|nr:cation:proton antiporter [Zavarzinella formosa]
MDHPNLIITLAGGLAAALVCGYITHRLGLSPIVGYLLAGLAVGPHTPGFIADEKIAAELAEIGVILLMFGVGLHFDVRDLLAVRKVAVPGAIADSLLITLIGFGAGLTFGWSLGASVVFGLTMSVASTVVLVRVLADRRELHTAPGHIAVGWLVVEDLYAVLVLVLLPVVFQGEALGIGGFAIAVGWSVAKIALLVVFVILAGGKIVPWILARVSATNSRELFTLTVLVLALGIAVGSASLFGASMALGAFLAGTVVGRSDFSSRAAAEALPMRDAFAVLFFVSVGMLFNPTALLEHPGLIAAATVVVLIGKPTVAFLLLTLLRQPPRVALTVALALAQIGEFSFILATAGQKLEIIPAEAMHALVAAAIISISLNPLVCRLAGPLEKFGRRFPAIWKFIDRSRKNLPGLTNEPDNMDGDIPTRAIVVGYGPVGRTLVRLLQENNIEPTVVEMNLVTVQKLRAAGIRAVYGDASHEETVKEAGTERATAFILSSSDTPRAEEAIRFARTANPEIRVVARVGYLRDRAALIQAGADVVFTGEGEVALTMTEFLLRRLGATPDQIDRERDRIRTELFGRPLGIENVVATTTASQ